MFNQNIFTHSSSDYDSDSSNTSDYSGPSDSGISTDSLNSSNYSFTTDLLHYYRKDVLKQNHIKILTNRKRQTQNRLNENRYKNLYLKENDNHINSNENNNMMIGYDSGLTKDTPFIDYLINKRINFCEMGASSHIAAFIPAVNNSRCCFIRTCKGKDCSG